MFPHPQSGDRQSVSITIRDDTGQVPLVTWVTDDPDRVDSQHSFGNIIEALGQAYEASVDLPAQIARAKAGKYERYNGR